jgi:hypothetical protein
MASVEIVEEDPRSAESRGWEPPIWIIAVGLSVALGIGFVRASDVHDPRLPRAADPTPCVERASPTTEGSYAWNWCR